MRTFESAEFEPFICPKSGAFVDSGSGILIEAHAVRKTSKRTWTWRTDVYAHLRFLTSFGSS